jgi:hypothetical protein
VTKTLAACHEIPTEGWLDGPACHQGAGAAGNQHGKHRISTTGALARTRLGQAVDDPGAGPTGGRHPGTTRTMPTGNPNHNPTAFPSRRTLGECVGTPGMGYLERYDRI